MGRAFFADEVGTVVTIVNLSSALNSRSNQVSKQKATLAGRQTDCFMEGLMVLNVKQDTISRSDVMDGKP